jgi:hypothetical protein
MKSKSQCKKYGRHDDLFYNYASKIGYKIISCKFSGVNFAGVGGKKNLPPRDGRFNQKPNEKTIKTQINQNQTDKKQGKQGAEQARQERATS